MALQQLFQHNKQLEDDAVLDLDAVLHKATQETCEFIEAIQKDHFEEVVSEMADALTNILSVEYRLTGKVDGFEATPSNGRLSTIDIPIYLGKWNDAVQKYRGIYSRSSKSAEEVTQKTNLLVKSILSVGNSFVDKNFTLEELCTKTIDKFGERVDRYGKPIVLTDYIRNIPDFPKP